MMNGTSGHHRENRLALGPLDAMEGHQRPPRLMDVIERVLCRTFQRLPRAVRGIRHRLDQRKLAVDHEIDQRIDEVVDAEDVQPRTCRLDTVADRLEDVDLVIVKRDDVVCRRRC
jgi:hypothetical protein